MQVTSHGLPKVIDMIECSGSGDVATSTVVSSTSTDNEPRTITGLSGRTLLLNTGWTNPTNQWRLGIKNGYDFFPANLKSRIKNERMDMDKKLVTETLLDAQSSLAKHTNTYGTNGGSPGSKEQDLFTELTARVTALKSISSSTGSDDLGPVYDIVCWHDGKVWRAALDTLGNGDLRNSIAFTNYRVEKQWGVLDDNTLLTYALNIYDDGNIVSIVTDAGSHGTHVAGIVAAHHPGNPDMDGVAPGAQIISIKIGDTRLGSMETGTGLMRGLRAVIENGAHIINMSYGEPTARPAYGRFMELANHVVLQKGVIFISSAGNNGPALSTVGAPGGNNSHIIGVGAAVSQAMMNDQYALRLHYSANGHDTNVTGSSNLPSDGTHHGSEGSSHLSSSLSFASPVASRAGNVVSTPSLSNAINVPSPAFTHDRSLDTNFTWSSRGPTADGALGVSICAPGGAITSVPCNSLTRNQLMNGTSMSSPNAAGCVALILSGLKARGVPYTPYSIRRALENTAVTIPGSPDAFTVGHGMIQVASAFSHLVLQDVAATARAKSSMDGGLPSYPFSPNLPRPLTNPHGSTVSISGPFPNGFHPYMDITVANQGVGAGESTDRGVYWRDPGQSDISGDVSVTVTPTWPDSVGNDTKVSYQLRVALEPSAPGWLSVPSHVHIAHGGRSFTVHVDPRRLPPGRAHFAEILAYEVLPTSVETTLNRIEDGVSYLTNSSSTVVSSNASTDLNSLTVGTGSRKLGPLFRVPITVIRPENPNVNPTGCVYNFSPRNGDDAVVHNSITSRLLAKQSFDNNSGPLVLRPGKIHRRFIAVPPGASWLQIKVRRIDDGFGSHDHTGSVSAPVISHPSSVLKSARDTVLSPMVNTTSTPFLPPVSTTVGSSAADIANAAAEAAHAHMEKILGRPVPRRTPAPVVTQETNNGTNDTETDTKEGNGHGTTILPPPVPSPSVSYGASNVADASPRTIVVHAVQIIRHTNPKYTTDEKYLYMRPGDEDGITMAVAPGVTVEVDIGQFWSSLGNTAVTADVFFYGIGVSANHIDIRAGEGFSRLSLLPLLHDVIIRPIVRLNTWSTVLEPNTITGGQLPNVVPMTARDTLANGKRQYSLTLTYKLSLMDSVSRGSLRCPRVHGTLYEASFDAAIIVITNEHGRVVATTDTFPEKLDLRKGDYTVTFQIRHEDPSKLEDVRSSGATLVFSRPTPGGKDKEIVGIVTDNLASVALSTGSGAITSRRLRKNVPFDVFVTIPASATMPKGSKPGDILEGFLLLEDYTPVGQAMAANSSGIGKPTGTGAPGRNPTGITVRYYVGGNFSSSSSGGKKDKNDTGKSLTEIIRDAMISKLDSLNPEENAPVIAKKVAITGVPSTPSVTTVSETSTEGSTATASVSNVDPSSTEKLDQAEEEKVAIDGSAPTDDVISNDTSVTKNETIAPVSTETGTPVTVGTEETQPEETLPLRLADEVAVTLRVASPPSDLNDFYSLVHVLSTAYPNYLPLYQAVLSRVDDVFTKKFTNVGKSVSEGDLFSAAQVVIRQADNVINCIDSNAIAAYFGLRHDETSTASGPGATEHKRMTENKSILIDALWKKVRALCSIGRSAAIEGVDLLPSLLSSDIRPTTGLSKNANMDGSSGTLSSIRVNTIPTKFTNDDFDRAVKALGAWVNTSDSTYNLLSIENHLRNNRWACVLEAVNKLLPTMNKNEAEKSLFSLRWFYGLQIYACVQLGWYPSAALLAERTVTAYSPGSLTV